LAPAQLSQQPSSSSSWQGSPPDAERCVRDCTLGEDEAVVLLVVALVEPQDMGAGERATEGTYEQLDLVICEFVVLCLPKRVVNT